MRKFLCLFLVLLLLCGAAVPAQAAGVADPTVTLYQSEYSLVTAAPDSPSKVYGLYVDAAPAHPDHTLHYKWYESASPDFGSALWNETAEDAHYYNVDTSTSRTVYLWCGVYAENSEGLQSALVMSDRITVVIAPVHINGISVIEYPKKMEYSVGEAFDPTGMMLGFGYSDGNFGRGFVDGRGVIFRQTPFDKAGDIALTLKVEDEGFISSTELVVHVRDHTHAFGEWMVTTAPTCTEEGVRTRECDCGKTEREAIPAMGHKWDEGKITRQPTEEKEGELTYTCTACGKTRTESIPVKEAAESSSSASSSGGKTPGTKPAAKPDSSAPAAKEPKPAGPETPAAPESGTPQSGSGLPWWGITLIVLGSVGAGAGIGLLIVRILAKKKK